MTNKEIFTLFWRGPFSQWFPSEFKINGVMYNCAEQYMMASKARIFGDLEAVDSIMSTDNPQHQKHFGRGVSNFDIGRWKEICENDRNKHRRTKKYYWKRTRNPGERDSISEG